MDYFKNIRFIRKGIGKKTKQTLELILEKGVEEARKIIGKEKIEILHEKQLFIQTP